MPLVSSLLSILAGAALGAAPAQAAPSDVCALLGTDAVRAVQGVEVTGRRATAEVTAGLRFAQCVFTTGDFIHSVSLTVITDPPPAATDATRRFWETTFRPAAKPRPASGRVPRTKEPPRPVPGAGQEAFWTSNAKAGALYVLEGQTVLRVSVGGVADEEDRLRRSKTLALAALARLRSR